eukprot:gnl/MRDRNA2_/MRDRNA2_86681_c0_seq3.p1 gnl/MRDRNA2_/MRDRNA2_86681_c0~~gnl/MRDRNA2_/MRDRNA2_86681_c0_seq3.p1  ORF type:complete len:363 (+),score=98.96 gnl/MRDRNA2_/MRDRNA2_86681_c0_seq3:64-1152(+)
MMRTGLFLLAILGCAAEEKPADKDLTPEQKKRNDLKRRMDAADWSHPAKTFKKFFGKKGLERHSLSVKQVEELAVEVKNKSEWQAVSMTTYWDCSSQYCLSFKNGRDSLRKTCKNVNNEVWHKGPRKTDHAAAALGLFQGKDNKLYGTVAASASLGVDDKESLGCGKCYTIRRGDDGNFGGFYKDTKLTVMVSNWCPPTRDAPCPAPGKIGEFGTKFHFDLAVPGGGMGTMPTCAHTYEKEDNRGYARLKQAFNNTLHACSELPFELQKSCKLYHSKIAQSPLNIGLAFAEVDCPTELLDRFECNKPCPTCEQGLSFQQLDKLVRKGNKLTKEEQEAWEKKQGMDEHRAEKHQGFRQKLAKK